MHLKKFLLVAAILALPVGAQTASEVKLHQINLFPYDTLITPLDTITLKDMYFTQAECPDPTSRSVEMQGQVIKVTINQAPDACPHFTDSRTGEPLVTGTFGFTLGRFPAGQYDLQVWLRSNDTGPGLVAEKQIIVPKLPDLRTGLPQDNFSGLYSFGSGTDPSMLTVVQSGFSLYASLLVYDQNRQPVWYIIGQDLSGPNHPEIADPNQALYTKAFSRAQFDDALRPGKTYPDNRITMKAQAYKFSLSATVLVPITSGVLVPRQVPEFLGNATMSLLDGGNIIIIRDIPINGGVKEMSFFRAQF